ncbi:flavin reductase family protein [Bradyrhizobium sp. NP1]|uniref:flavin reductase family protein n=1 Tax=Bradyrhizobium sp. NP1 TaxID=3049772 RepID=UPI0025A5D1FE|nr:flavin reductase family protein [Bradyrhizobium sp. NP1]WJR80836.1 flavin reductase family protein [Bradyrhizobium sp. NP1]
MDSSLREEAAAAAAREQVHALRRCLGHFATGVAVVSYETATQGPRGLTVNSFTSVSLDPPLVLICLDRRSRAIEHLPGSPFAVNVLAADQRHLAHHFAGRVTETAPAWRRVGGVPLLDRSLAWLTCAPWSNHEGGDHVILLGRVTEFGSDPHDPLCFYRGEFIGVAPSPGQRDSEEVTA